MSEIAPNFCLLLHIRSLIDQMTLFSFIANAMITFFGWMMGDPEGFVTFLPTSSLYRPSKIKGLFPSSHSLFPSIDHYIMINKCIRSKRRQERTMATNDSSKVLPVSSPSPSLSLSVSPSVARERLQARLQEIEMLQSVYCQDGEFRVITPPSLTSLQKWVDSPNNTSSTRPIPIPTPNHMLVIIVCSVAINNTNTNTDITDATKDGNDGATTTATNVTIEVEVTMPVNYPRGLHTIPLDDTSRPLVCVRCASFNRNTAHELTSIIQQIIDDTCHEPCLLSLPDLVNTNALQALIRQRVAEPVTTKKLELSPDVRTREFILFHHIYSNAKRKTIIDTANDLKLTGCYSFKPYIHSFIHSMAINVLGCRFLVAR
jgi:hypothetical protein